ncbi:MAG: hypothetical protein M0023_04285 [Desulfobacteraceae bacterium]|nr:hypothetical protein [Desulfobacteraceae bacterium]
MSRKPIDQQQPTECRQAIWDAIRAFSHVGTFTVGSVEIVTRCSSGMIREYLTGLTAAGYLEIKDYPSLVKKVALPLYYRLINDCGNDAPRVRKDGTAVTQGQGRLQMWNAMRILKTFTTQDLAFNSSTDDHTVAVSEAKAYIGALCKSGYLVGRSEGKFMLIPAMWTGPHPPQIQRTKQVYDPNLKRVVWSKIEGGAE